MTFNLFLIVMNIVGRSFPREKLAAFPPQRRGVSSFLVAWHRCVQFLKSLFKMRLNLRTIRCGRWDQWKNSHCIYGTNLWKSSFLSCILSQPYCRKAGVFLRAVVGWELDQNSMECTCKSFCCLLSGALVCTCLGHCMSILERHIYFCVLFCANKNGYFCLWLTPVM